MYIFVGIHSLFIMLVCIYSVRNADVGSALTLLGLYAAASHAVQCLWLYSRLAPLPHPAPVKM